MKNSGFYAKIAELTEEGRHFAIATVIAAHGSSPRGVGAKMAILDDGTRIGTIGGDCLENYVVYEATQMIANDKTHLLKTQRFTESPAKIVNVVLEEEELGGVGMLCGGKVDVLIEVQRPELRVVVCGSGPVAASVLRLADFLDIKGILIDPIPPPPSEKLPATVIFINDKHELGLRQAKVTKDTAIVLVTRHKNDVPALRAAIETEASYIGMIGSKHRVQTIFNRVAEAINAPVSTFINRVYAPVGLDIGAQTPQEIAVSILSEILAHFRYGTGRSMALREKKSSVEPITEKAPSRPNSMKMATA